jgi:hypothetical protein
VFQDKIDMKNVHICCQQESEQPSINQIESNKNNDSDDSEALSTNRKGQKRKNTSEKSNNSINRPSKQTKKVSTIENTIEEQSIKVSSRGRKPKGQNLEKSRRSYPQRTNEPLNVMTSKKSAMSVYDDIDLDKKNLSNVFELDKTSPLLTKTKLTRKSLSELFAKSSSSWSKATNSSAQITNLKKTKLNACPN